MQFYSMWQVDNWDICYSTTRCDSDVCFGTYHRAWSSSILFQRVDRIGTDAASYGVWKYKYLFFEGSTVQLMLRICYCASLGVDHYEKIYGLGRNQCLSLASAAHNLATIRNYHSVYSSTIVLMSLRATFTLFDLAR